MAYCEHCGSEIENNEKFCPVCGAELEEITGTESGEQEKGEAETGDPAETVVFCPECGCKNAEGDAFCEACGAPLTREAETIRVGQTAAAGAGFSDQSGGAGGSSCSGKPVQSDGKRAGGKRGVSFLLAGAAAVAVIGGAALVLPRLGSSGEKGVQGCTYEKDNTLYYTDGKKTLEIAEPIVRDASNYYMRSRVEYSEDGRYIYFTAKHDTTGAGTLYRKDLKKESEQNDTEEKIASGVSALKMAGNRLFYTKNNSLYVYENGETQKLATDVGEWYTSGDGARLFYTDSQQRLYYMPVLEKGAEEKVASDCMYILSCTDDLKVMYYQDDNSNLYVVREGKKEKIASEITMAVPYGNKQFIYYATEGDDFSLTRLFDDDMALVDAQCSEPKRENYSGKWNGTYFSFDSAGYNEAWKAYREKQERDEIRGRVYGEDQGIPRFHIYAYDGTESRLLLENAWQCYEAMVCKAVGENSYDNYESALYAKQYAEEALPVLRISEMDSSSTLSGMFYQKLSGENVKSQVSIVSDGCIAGLETESDQDLFYVDTANHVIYQAACRKTVEDGYDVWKISELLKIPYSEKGAGEAVMLDDDVENLLTDEGESVFSSCMLVKDQKLYYVADYDWNRMEGSLRCDGREILDDVFYCHEENGTVFVEYDFNSSSSSSCLGMLQKDETIVELGEDVYESRVLPDGSVIYLDDYDPDRMEGDLYLWKKGEISLLDEDVSGLTYP